MASAKHDGRVPGWVWLFTGVLLGALIVLLLRLSALPAPQAAPAALYSSYELPAAEEPKFTFYETLKGAADSLPLARERQPAAKLAVAQPSKPQTPPKATTKALEAPSDGTAYALQVASFRSQSDAETVRAQLLLLNLDARIERAQLKTGETWHRVIVGPYRNRSELNKAQSTLATNRFEAMVIKRNAG